MSSRASELPAAPPAAPVTPVWPLLAAALAALCFIGMDTVIKLLAPRHDALELTFFRFASGSIFAVLLWGWRRSPMPRRGDWPLHGLRSLLLLMSLTGYFHGLRLLPLAQVVALSYLAPIFLSLLAVLVLHERPSRWIWLALGIGAAGVAVSVLPALDGTAGGSLEGLLAVTVGAMSFAGVMVLARRQAQRDALWTILLLQNLLPTLALALPFAWFGSLPAAADLLPIVAAGALATVGLLCLTWAFTHLEASRAAPVEFTSLVWAGALGYLVFGEVPTWHTAASAGLIVFGCLLLLRR